MELNWNLKISIQFWIVHIPRVTTPVCLFWSIYIIVSRHSLFWLYPTVCMQAWMSKHIKTQESSSKRHFVLSGVFFVGPSLVDEWVRSHSFPQYREALITSCDVSIKLPKRERGQKILAVELVQLCTRCWKSYPAPSKPRRGGGLEALLVSHWYCGHMKRNLSIHYQKWSLYISAYVWECMNACLSKAVCRKCLACHV